MSAPTFKNLDFNIIDIIEEFSTLPVIYSSLLDTLSRSHSSVDEVSRIIANDQASTLKILKMVNSAFYGFQGQIDTLSRAILILGFNEIYNLILTSSLLDMFSKKPAIASFRPKDFWKHSIAAGIASKLIGRAAGIVNLENFFIAGVLHDFGKLIFFEFLGDQLAQALALSKKNHQSLSQSELAVMGIDHAEAGALIAEKWRLPESLCLAVRYHHSGIPPKGPDRLVAAVHVGNILARSLNLGFPGDDLIPPFNQQVWDILEITPRTWKKMVPELLTDYEDTIKIFLA